MMNKQTQEALKIENSDFNKCTKQELFECIVVLREALEQSEDYLYVYKGSEIWLKDSLDIPSAGFLIGKIRLEK